MNDLSRECECGNESGSGNKEGAKRVNTKQCFNYTDAAGSCALIARRSLR